MQFAHWILAALAIGTAGRPAASSLAPQASRRPTINCVKFSSPGRLNAGTLFKVPVAPDLELRLRPDGDSGWQVTVGPRRDEFADYLWVVSPPFQTAPHRVIGAAYGTTARQSAQLERRFRFVLNAADYETARKVVETEEAGNTKLATLNALGRGTVRLRITDFRIRDDVRNRAGAEIDAFDWIRFAGEICVPR